MLKSDYDTLKKFNKYFIVYELELLEKVITTLINISKNINLNCLKNSYSISSLAINFYRSNFNQFNFIIQNTFNDDKLFRKAYYGGRCEVFGNIVENEKLFQFDFKGMYAQIMLTKFPYGAFEKKINVKNVDKEGFYWVKIKSESMEFPALPHHSLSSFSVNKSKLLFTNGIFEGLYWWEELQLFEAQGGLILEIKFALFFFKQDFLFYKYTTYFTKLRNESEIGNFWGKILINSISGRLGMQIKSTKTVFINSNKEYEVYLKNENILKETCVGKSLKILEIEKKSNIAFINSCVHVAAIITARARVKLYKGILDVQAKGGRVLYVDTDSIFAAFTRSVIGEKHGEVEWDSNQNSEKIHDCVFAAPKCYAIKYENKEVIKIKGLNPNALTFNQFKKLFYNDEVSIHTYDRLFKNNWNLKRTEFTAIILFNNYDKRVFKNNKKFTNSINFVNDKYFK